MENILLSVIVPIYNVEAYVEKCIESIIVQTYRNLQIILVDDGSSDNSGAICDYYSKYDSRITTIHKKNEGLVEARKTGASLAQGEYIINVDGDDWIERERFQILTNAIRKYDADIIHLDGYYSDSSSGSTLISHKELNGYFTQMDFLECLLHGYIKKNCFHIPLAHNMWCLAVKASLYREIQFDVPKQVTHMEDAIFWWLSLLRIKNILLIKNPTYHYLQRDDSMTSMMGYRDINGILISYEMLKKRGSYMGKHFQLGLLYFFTRGLLVTDYSIFMRRNYEYLFPFSQVKKGSRIAIYGSGKFGCRLVREVLKTFEFSLMMWVDRKANIKLDFPVKVKSKEELLKCEVDYVVVAIIDYDIACVVKNDLIRMGIENEKIALIDANVVTEENLNMIVDSMGID